MAKEEAPRKASLAVKYKGSTIDEKIQKYASNFSYTDVASGASDSINITLSNIDKKWLNEWMPNKGDSISASVSLTNWNKAGEKKTFECGSFTIDDLSYSGRPLIANIGAVSVPASEGFKATKKSKTWEDVTILEIAREKARDAGLTLYYSSRYSIKLSEVEQSNETDSSFLYSLCEKYGLAMKVYNDRLVIFEELAYELMEPVATIDEKDMLSWNFNTTIDGTYTGVKLTYTDPDTDKTTYVTVGTTGRIYEYSAQVTGKYDAELQAKAKMRSENKKITKIVFKIKANTAIIATSVVKITGLGKANGLYYVDSLKHSIGKGYTMSISAHKFADAESDSEAKAKAGVKSKQRTHTVKAYDTLWGIAKQYYGSGAKYKIIYEANKATIEAAARAHGKKNSDGGHWIWAGTVLVIPDEN